MRITLPQFEKIKERAGPFLRPGCCRCCDKRWPAHASADRYAEREDALEAELFTHMQCRLTQNTPKNPKSARNGGIIPNRRFIPNQILQSSNVLRSGTNMTPSQVPRGLGLAVTLKLANLKSNSNNSLLPTTSVEHKVPQI